MTGGAWRGGHRPLASRMLLLTSTAILLAGCAISPEPITTAEQQVLAQADRSAMFADQEPVERPISLEEAIARALKYNLEHRAALVEEVLRNRQFDLGRWDLLPQLTADAGLVTRSNELASSSESVVTGTQSLEPSTSQDKTRGTAKLGLSWSILDFGASYYQAKQQADRALIAGQRRRQVVNALVQQVRDAWWRAATARRMRDQAQPILAETRGALADAHEIERQRLRPPLETLRYQRALIEIRGELEGIDGDLALAKAELAELMNLAPRMSFEVEVPPVEDAPPAWRMPLGEMEEFALAHRPELREAAYQSRITRHQAREALLRLLPGLELNSSFNYDSNDFLVNQTWLAAGVQVSSNLLNVLRAPATLETNRARTELARAQRLAMSMAVITQVHIALRQYQRTREHLERANELSDIEGRIRDHVVRAAAGDASSTLERIHSSAAAVVARLERDRAYAEVRHARARLYASIGVDPLPKTVESYGLNALIDTLADFDRALPDTDAPAAPQPVGSSGSDEAAILPVPRQEPASG